MSLITSAMLRYKLYATRDDYVSVTLTILRKYLFFKSTNGTAYVTKHLLPFFIAHAYSVVNGILD